MPAIEVCHIVNVLSVCTGVDSLGIWSLTPGDTTRPQFELNTILNSAFLHRRLSILTFSYPVLNSHCSTFQNLTQLDVIHNIWIEWSWDVFDSLPIFPGTFRWSCKSHSLLHCKYRRMPWCTVQRMSGLHMDPKANYTLQDCGCLPKGKSKMCVLGDGGGCAEKGQAVRTV